MKIGRNDKCICGSGKKYKHCCLNKLQEKIVLEQPFVPQEDFSYSNIDKELVKEFKKIFSEYDFFELCRAVFCMNSLRANRRELVFYLSLNTAIIECEKNGKKNIKKYIEFKNFYNQVKKFYKKSILTDDNVPDFGEILISFNNNYYPVFVGTGHNFIFSFMQCISTIAYFTKKEEEVEYLLNYVKHMINSLKDANPHESNSSKDNWYLPSSKYFSACCIYYQTKTHNDMFHCLHELVYNPKEKKSNAFFVNFNEVYYPLFDPGIIVSFIEILLKKVKDDDRKQLADYCLLNAIELNYAIDSSREKLFYPVGIVENFEEKRLYNGFGDGILLVGEKSAVLFVNDEIVSKEFNTSEYINKINIIHKKQNLEFIEISQNKNMRCITVTPQLDLIIVSYNNYLNINSNFFLPLERNEFYRKMLLDIIFILFRSETVDELCEFYNFIVEKHFQNHGFDGESAIFETWKSQGGLISQGAIDFSMLYTELNLPEWNMFSYYKELEEYYPLNHHLQMFSNPHLWKKKKEPTGYYSFSNKAVFGFGGYYKKVGDSNIFIAHNLNFEGKDEKIKIISEKYHIFDDLLTRLFNVYQEILISNGFYNNYGVQITYLPIEYATRVDDNGFLNKNKKYVKSDAFNADQRILIRFSVNEEIFFNDLTVASNKEVECEFFIELLSCLENTSINLSCINSYIEKDKSNKKDIAIIQGEMKYIFSNENYVGTISDKCFLLAKKEIAYSCLNANIECKEYEGKMATDIIRKIQKLLIPEFEKKFTKFNKFSLHIKLLSKLAYYTHEKKVNAIRYTIIEDPNISDEAKIVTGNNIRNSREKNKTYIKNILFLIETNLFVNSNAENYITDDELDYLIAFSDWLIVLQDNADLCHKGINFVKIVVDDNYLVETIAIDSDSTETQKRLYSNEDYHPKQDKSSFIMEDIFAAFYDDTKISMRDIMSICEYLSNEFTYIFKQNEIAPDVYKINKETAINDLFSILKRTPKNEETKKSLSNALDYLIINPCKLKFLIDKDTEFLPIWEREKRDNRFDMKPIIETNGDIIFSPIIMYELLKIWQNGLLDFYPPYEIGLTRMCERLSCWKQSHELQMEKDLFSLFPQEKYLYFAPNFDFHDKDNLGNSHPIELGDYDLVAIDTKNKTIWNLESKHLHKVGSVFEFYAQQKGFFLQNKYDEKFQRRINYLKEHLVDLFRILNINDDFTDYKQIDYMVTNKVFLAIVKKINFAIITFYELEQNLKHLYTNV